MRGPRCCSGFTLVLASRGYSPVVVCGLLLLWLLSLLSTSCNSCGSPALVHRLNGCGAPAYVLRGMWDLPRSGIEPVFPALAGGFFLPLSHQGNLMYSFFIFGCARVSLLCTDPSLSWSVSFSGCGEQAQQWQSTGLVALQHVGSLLPNQGSNPALEGGFLTTGPPGMSARLDFLKITDQPAFTEPIPGLLLSVPKSVLSCPVSSLGTLGPRGVGSPAQAVGVGSLKTQLCPGVLPPAGEAATRPGRSGTGCLLPPLGRERAAEEEDAGPRPTGFQPPDQGPGGHGPAADLAGERHSGAGGAGADVHPGRL